MKFVIWGAGHWGKVVSEWLGKEKILAFIDSNSEKIGKIYQDRPTIDYNTYKKKYCGHIIIVCILGGDEIIDLLERDNVFYFNIEKCPPELMGYGWYKAKHIIKEKEITLPDNIILYGSTLYTVLVYEKLYAEGYKYVSVYLPSFIKHKERTMFSEKFSEIPIVKKEDIKDQYIVLTEKVKQIDVEFKNKTLINIVDWTQYVDDYHNTRIEAMNNKYKGKRCFIVATGPSLTYEDLACLNKNQEFCISVNSIFTCFNDTVWRPDCYVVVDSDGITMWKDAFQTLTDIPYKFIADCQPYFDYSQLDDNWYIYHSIWDEYSIKNMLFGEDFSRVTYDGSTVVYVCMQLAIYLGFEKIYLLGVDFEYKENGKNHFTEQIEPYEQFEGMSGQQKLLDLSYLAFQKAKEYATEHGIKIFNASRKSCLDVFEKVDFDTLFQD